MSLTHTSPEHDTRQRARWNAVSAEHGIASLRHTHWLEPEPRSYADAPGTWAGRDGRVIGVLPDGSGERGVVLSPGEDLRIGDLLLRAIDRHGSLALRVFDPLAPTRVALRGIHSFPFDGEWILPGRFVPADEGETRVVLSLIHI